MSRDLGSFREAYQRGVLRRADLAPDPVTQFEQWWDQWMSKPHYDAAACVLATTGSTGVPTARYVLCRRFDQDGFEIYTNQESRKARDMRANPRAALVFGWLEDDHQVRVEGPVTLVDDETADAYWASRPRGSQLSGWASDQSEVLADREELERHRDEALERFGGSEEHGDPIPRPPHWGGYRIGIDRMEFWQGRPDRLHDRFLYHRDPADHTRWQIDRLSP
ncbi:MAG: pyridoxamine 5-phosphate oxidase [Acidimicrobiales bacterium]|nr:pyridoxamine 5-phosphate oxidase [Acidimicrobiales bacterium]